VERGAPTALAILLRVQRWCLRSTACRSCSDRASAAGCSERSVDPPERCDLLTVSLQPLVGGTEADPSFCGKDFEGMALVKMTTNELFPTE
jgi:hypothetical protein